MVIHISHRLHDLFFSLDPFAIPFRQPVREQRLQAAFDKIIKEFFCTLAVFRYELRIMVFRLESYVASVNNSHDIAHCFFYDVFRQDAPQPFLELFICLDVQLVIAGLIVLPLLETQGS